MPSGGQASADHAPDPGEQIRLKGVTKRFGNREVLSDVDITFRSGEFIALLGSNGAGKSTLIKVLAGVYRPDAGTVHGVTVNGERTVGVVHQDLGIAAGLTVLENFLLGAPPRRTRVGTVDRLAERRAARRALDGVGIGASLDAPASSLGPKDLVLLAIARLDAAALTLIVLDEVTSTLTESEAEELIASLRAASLPHTCFMMVSHRLSEVVALATRVLVLHEGRLVVDSEETLEDAQQLAAFLARIAPAVESASRPESAAEPGEALLTLTGVCSGSSGPLNLQVRAGEIIGVTSRLSATLYDLAMVVLKHKEATGETWTSPGVRVAFVSPDRAAHGNFSTLSVRWNLTVPSLWRWRSRSGLLSLGRERREADRSVRELSVSPPDGRVEQGTLSGGNQQKVLFGRALLCEARIYVLCEPTRGVDVATRAQLYDTVRDLKKAGSAVLMISTDPDDIVNLSDRVIVLDERWQVVDDLGTDTLSAQKQVLL